MSDLTFGVGRWFPPLYVATVRTPGYSVVFRYGYTRTTALLRGMFCAWRERGIVYALEPYDPPAN